MNESSFTGSTPNPDAISSASQKPIEIGEILFVSRDPIVKIATGRSHVLALDTKGKVWSWGTNDKGQLGLGI